MKYSHRERIQMYLLDELSPEDKTAFESELQHDAQLRQKYEEWRNLYALLKRRGTQEPSEEMLREARLRLRKQLREENSAVMAQGRWYRIMKQLTVKNNGQQIAWSVALLAVGFFIGQQFSFYESSQQMMRLVSPKPFVSDVSLIQYEPNTGMVTVQYNTINEVSRSGDIADPEIRHVLSHAIRTDHHPGRRLAAVKAMLTGEFSDPELEDALVYAVQHDSIAGVRLKSARVLKRLPINPQIQAAFISVLLNDENAAVRMAALDVLQYTVTQSGMAPVFRNAARSDENESVRLRASKVLQQISYPEL